MTLSPGAKGPAETLNFAFARGVQRRLQFDVERTRANAAPVHRAKHLDVADRVQAEALGDAGLHQLGSPSYPRPLSAWCSALPGSAAPGAPHIRFGPIPRPSAKP